MSVVASSAAALVSSDMKHFAADSPAMSALDAKAVSVASEALAVAFGFRPSMLTLLWHMGDRIDAMERNAPTRSYATIQEQAQAFAKKAAASSGVDAEVNRRAELILRKVLGYPERRLPPLGSDPTIADEIIKSVIERKFSLEFYEDKFRALVPARATGALFSAAEAGHVDVVKALLQAGTKGNEFVVEGMLLFIREPACSIAAMTDQLEVVRAFIEHEESLIEFYFSSKERELREELCHEYGNPEILTYSKSLCIKLAALFRLRFSLRYACQQKQGMETVRLFLERYSDVIALADQLLIHCLAFTCVKGIASTARLLLSAGADPDREAGIAIEIEGHGRILRDKSALNIATQLGHKDVIEALLNAGASKEGLLAPLRKVFKNMATEEVVAASNLLTIEAATAFGADRRGDRALHSSFEVLSKERKVSVLKAIVVGAREFAYSRRRFAVVACYDGIAE